MFDTLINLNPPRWYDRLLFWRQKRQPNLVSIFEAQMMLNQVMSSVVDSMEKKGFVIETPPSATGEVGK